jgi:hypothetical protein
MMFKVLKTDGAARRGEYTTPHGTVQTPVFMNVGTQAAIKGGLDAIDLENIGCQVELSNTYHLHLRPGEETAAAMGGLHKFSPWFLFFCGTEAPSEVYLKFAIISMCFRRGVLRTPAGEHSSPLPLDFPLIL